MFMVLSSWQSHCESSPGLYDECRTPPSGCRYPARRLRLWVRLYRHYTHYCQLSLLLSLKADTHSTIPQRGEGWVNLVGLVTYRDGLPANRQSSILVLTGFDVAQLRRSRPTCTTKPNHQPWTVTRTKSSAVAETVWRFVSLNILLKSLTLFEMTPLSIPY